MFPSTPITRADGYVQRAQEIAARRAALEADEAQLVIEVEQWRADCCSIYRGSEDLLRTATGVTASTARHRAATYRQLLVLPAMAQALAAGRVTFDHARLLADHADSPNRDAVLDAQEELTGWATEMSAD